TLPGGDIETGIEISEHDGNYSASLVNGQERVRIDDVRYADGELVLRFPAFNNEIRAVLAGDRLIGALTLVKRFGATQVLPFAATQGGAARTENGAQANHDLSGRWAVKFHEPDGSDSASIGEFAQRGSRLYGTFLNPNGDHRFLAGHIRGDDFHLSTFDGSHAFIFSGSINDAGKIVNADFWSGTSWHQLWSGERNESVELPDAFSRTFLKPGYERFEFSFPDEEGDVVSIDDEKFQDKVVMVAIAGTWCPNCNDEARFLAPFHKQYRDQGLEVVGLMFEHFDDVTIASDQVRLFRDKHGIEYDTLIAGISDKTEAGKVLPALSAVLAFPTTIFIDRSGRVRHIHTGFTGPGTGEHYVELQNRFRELVTELLSEPSNLIESLTTDEI
ncbi:MAG: TlpA family protein disulfide reductase, partial [Gammaproteobacteria bacterium]|nr:TlpA family protein disulfide reductase [Gammaproteobacteria bacterium]